jgi:hypothetical protein
MSSPRVVRAVAKRLRGGKIAYIILIKIKCHGSFVEVGCLVLWDV